MGKLILFDENHNREEVDVIVKNIWCRIEGEDEDQTIHIELSPFSHQSPDMNEVAFKCVNYLQFESGKWSRLDFSRYPFKVLFGYTCEVNGSMDHWYSHVFEGYTTAEPDYDGSALYIFDVDTRHKDYVPPSYELIERAAKHGLIWCPDEEVFEDEFFRSMYVDRSSNSVYLSDGVWIDGDKILLRDIEKVLDEIENEKD